MTNNPPAIVLDRASDREIALISIVPTRLINNLKLHVPAIEQACPASGRDRNFHASARIVVETVMLAANLGPRCGRNVLILISGPTREPATKRSGNEAEPADRDSIHSELYRRVSVRERLLIVLIERREPARRLSASREAGNEAPIYLHQTCHVRAACLVPVTLQGRFLVPANDRHRSSHERIGRKWTDQAQAITRMRAGPRRRRTGRRRRHPPARRPIPIGPRLRPPPIRRRRSRKTRRNSTDSGSQSPGEHRLRDRVTVDLP